MTELKKYECWTDFMAETYTNGELTNSLQGIWENMDETNKKVNIILHYGRIIIKSPNPEIIENYFSSKNIVFEEDKDTPPEEIKYLIKDKLESISLEKLDEMLNYFRAESWEILKSHSINDKPNRIKANKKEI